MKLTTSEIIEKTRRYNLAGWQPRGITTPLAMVKGEGIYFWDVNGKRYCDWSSMQMNVNLGHAHHRLVRAIQNQAGKMTCLNSHMTSEARARLGEELARFTPLHLRKNYLTLGATDALDSALKIARLYSGREKVLIRQASFHEEVLACCGPYLLPEKFGPPWLVKIPLPCMDHDLSFKRYTQPEYDQIVAEQVNKKLLEEGPQNVAAILLPGYISEYGVNQGGETFWKNIQDICETHGILMIVDESLSGFGRTGEWFGIDHYPFVRPDILVFSSSLTSGYVPIGAVMVSDEISEHLEKDSHWCGMNYNAHSLACTAALTTLEIYESDGIIRYAKRMGQHLKEGLEKLAEKHPSLGAVRGSGLFYMAELVKDKQSGEPLCGEQQPWNEPMLRLNETLLENGLSTILRGSRLLSAPPLIIKPRELEAGLEIIDKALYVTDRYVGN